MDVFSLRRDLIGGYSAFARSFTYIRAEDIRAQVDAAFASGRYWPEPLSQINPRFKPGKTVIEHAQTGELYSASKFGVSVYSSDPAERERLVELSELIARFADVDVVRERIPDMHYIRRSANEFLHPSNGERFISAFQSKGIALRCIQNLELILAALLSQNAGSSGTTIVP